MVLLDAMLLTMKPHHVVWIHLLPLMRASFTFPNTPRCFTIVSVVVIATIHPHQTHYIPYIGCFTLSHIYPPYYCHSITRLGMLHYWLCCCYSNNSSTPDILYPLHWLLHRHSISHLSSLLLSQHH